MELFFKDNHFVDEAKLFSVPADLSPLLIQIREIFPFLNHQSQFELIGETNINSMNFKCGEYYIKLIEKRDNEKKYVESFPAIAKRMVEKEIPANNLLASKNDQKIEIIHFNRKSFYCYLTQFTSLSFYSGHKNEFIQMMNIIKNLLAVSDDFKSIVSQDDRYQIYDLKEKMPPLMEAAQNQSGEFEKFLIENNKLIWQACELYNKHRPHELTKVPLHCDLHPLNILIESGQIRAIIDLESFVFMPREIFTSFTIFKLARKSYIKNLMSLNEIQEVIEDHGFNLDQIKTYTQIEAIRRLSIVLHYHFNLKDLRLDADLKKQVAAINESSILFTRSSGDNGQTVSSL